MKTPILGLVAAAVLAVTASTASAMPVVVPFMGTTDTNGNFSVTVNNPTPSDGNGGLVNITAIGTPGTLASSSFDLIFDGPPAQSGTSAGSMGFGVFTTVFQISPADLLDATTQSSFFMTFLGTSVPANTFVTGSLNYNGAVAAVPEPATMSLLAIGGVTGAGVYRRRRRAAAAV